MIPILPLFEFCNIGNEKGSYSFVSKFSIFFQLLIGGEEINSRT